MNLSADIPTFWSLFLDATVLASFISAFFSAQQNALEKPPGRHGWRLDKTTFLFKLFLCGFLTLSMLSHCELNCEKSLQKPTSAETFVTSSFNGFKYSEILLDLFVNIVKTILICLSHHIIFQIKLCKIITDCVQYFHIVYDLDELIKFSHFLLTLLKHKEVKRGDG
jgi:hypothetical protein